MFKKFSLMLVCFLSIFIYTALPLFADDVTIVPTWSYTFSGVRGTAGNNYIDFIDSPGTGDILGKSVNFKNNDFSNPNWSFTECNYRHNYYFGSDYTNNARSWTYPQKLTYDFSINSFDGGAVTFDLAFFSMQQNVNDQYATPYLYVYDNSKKQYIPSTDVGMGVGVVFSRGSYTYTIPTYYGWSDGTVTEQEATYNVTAYYQSFVADLSNINKNYTKFRVVISPQIMFLDEYPTNLTRQQIRDEWGSNPFYGHYTIPVYRGEVTWSRDVSTATRVALQNISDNTAITADNTSIIVSQLDTINNDINTNFSDLSSDISSTLYSTTEILADTIESSTDQVVHVMEEAPQSFKDDLEDYIDEVEGWEVEYLSWTEAYEQEVDSWSDGFADEISPTVNVVSDFTHSNLWNATIDPLFRTPIIVTLIGTVVTLAILHFILTGKVS